METQVFDYDLEDDAGRRLACATTIEGASSGGYVVTARLSRDGVVSGPRSPMRHTGNMNDALTMARHMAACMRRRCETRDAAGYLRRISDEEDENEGGEEE